MIAVKNAGIFAAGLGKRFAKYFPNTPKPMITVSGRPLIEWTVKLLSLSGLENFTILLNSKGSSAREHLKKVFPNKKFVFIVKDTASSYESFCLVSQILAQTEDNFILSAVDSLHKPLTLKSLVNFKNSDFDAALSVTDDIGDEKPLWADIDADSRITALGNWASVRKYATGGLYLLTKKLAGEMPTPGQFKALREYLTEIILQDKKIFSVYGRNVDIDTPADIALAEKFIGSYIEKPGVRNV